MCNFYFICIFIVLDLKRRSPPEIEASQLRRQRQREDAEIVKRIMCIVFLYVLCITPITVAALLYYFLLEYSVWNGQIVCIRGILFLLKRLVESMRVFYLK